MELKNFLGDIFYELALERESNGEKGWAIGFAAAARACYCCTEAYEKAAETQKIIEKYIKGKEPYLSKKFMDLAERIEEVTILIFPNLYEQLEIEEFRKEFRERFIKMIKTGLEDKLRKKEDDNKNGI